MIRSNPYRVNKLAYHPNAISNLRKGSNDTLLQVHLMPQNACNQRCNFCSYRMPKNRNSLNFHDTKSIPFKDLQRLITDMKELRVRAVEVTGGGEPLLYKYKYKMFELLLEAGFDVALVTNGTLLDDRLAELLAPNLTWMRVSIDAATVETYCSLRNASERHFKAALESIKKIRSRGGHKPEFKLGVGYVMSNGNELETYDTCKLAKELGADNIRLSMTFSEKHIKYFKDKERLKEGMRLAEKAVQELTDESFQVINLIPERYENILEYTNNYHYCYTKDVLCVVEGEGNVYTCCTFTGSNKGKLGNFLKHKDGFKGIWSDSQTFRKKLNPKTYCNVTCLYAKRNLEMIDMIESDDYHVSNKEEPIHVNFI